MIEALRNDLVLKGYKIKVFCGDIEENILTRYKCDIFWRMPETLDQNFEQILDYLLKHKINLIIPTRDGELTFWAKHKDKLANAGIYVSVSPTKVISTCLNKLSFFHHCEAKSLDSIPILGDIESISSRHDSYVIKEKFGAGSGKIFVNLPYKELHLKAKLFSNPIIQPYVDGKEYSIDCYVSKTCGIEAIIPRERFLVIGGESHITKIKPYPLLEEFVHSFVSSLNFSGHIIVQAIEYEIGKFTLLECNPRFGGASTSSVYYGMRSFLWIAQELLGMEPNYAIDKTKKLTQIRSKKDELIWS